MMSASTLPLSNQEQMWDADLPPMADFDQRQASKSAIDKAGRDLIAWYRAPAEVELDNAVYATVDNWRNCHGLPLSRIRRDLRARLNKLGLRGTMANRLKRFTSILMKLEREPKMKLSQMQDLGGCRVIVATLDQVYAIGNCYRTFEATPYVHTADCRHFDYLSAPKEDGYRGLHVVCRFTSPSRTYSPWEGQRVEVQIRTRLQHAFATAVETVTTFSSEPLKFGGGPDDWRRFFALVGSAFARQEGTAPVPNTPDNKSRLVAEVKALAKTLQVKKRLRHWSQMVRAVLPQIEAAKFDVVLPWLLLSLSLSDNTLSVKMFTEYRAARDAVILREQAIAGGAREDAVLVSVASLLELRKAYPNYYADTSRFLRALDRVLATHSSRKSRATPA